MSINLLMESGSLLNASGIQKGELIDKRYNVQSLIASSEHEALFVVNDTKLDNAIVELKVFHADKSVKARDVQRFRSEVIIARKLSHPNIGRVYDLGRFNSEYHYITSQYHKSAITLKDYIESFEEKGLPYEIALDIFYQLANALHEAHKQSVLHRNITDENILVVIDKGKLKNVYLTNFGHGKLLGHDLYLTRTGEMLGMPVYMSPEQIMGLEVDAASDIYSLGILMFKMLSGKLPFPESDVPTVLTLKNRVLPDIKQYRNDLPDWLVNLVNSCARNDKDQRVGSAKKLREVILVELGIDKLKPKKEVNNILSKYKVKLFFTLFICSVVYLGVSNSALIIRSLSGGENAEAERQEKIISAVLSGDDSIVYSMLNEGISPHLKDKMGIPLICLAAEKGHLNVIYTLMKADPSVVKDVDPKGQNALKIARTKKNIDLQKMLEK